MENVQDSETEDKDKHSIHTQFRPHLGQFKRKRCPCAEILIVDDDPFNIHVLSNLLVHKYGFKVETAFNGQMAIEIVKSRQMNNVCCPTFGLVFMDFDMPIKNGYEASREISKFLSGMKKRTVICLHSALLPTSTDGLKEMKNTGISLTLKKPLSNNVLEQHLLKVFPLYRMKNYRIKQADHSFIHS